MSESSNPLPLIQWGTAAPTSTDELHQKGEIVLNSQPDAGEVNGWRCTVQGRPGTWVPIDFVPGLTTITAAAQLTAAKETILLTAAGTYTLAVAASHSAGFRHSIKNISAGSVTLATAAGATYNDAAAITLADDASVTLVTNATTWYKLD